MQFFDSFKQLSVLVISFIALFKCRESLMREKTNLSTSSVFMYVCMMIFLKIYELYQIIPDYFSIHRIIRELLAWSHQSMVYAFKVFR